MGVGPQHRQLAALNPPHGRRDPRRRQTSRPLVRPHWEKRWQEPDQGQDQQPACTGRSNGIQR